MLVTLTAVPSAVFASQPLECPALGNQKGKKSSWPAAWSIPLHLVHLQLLGSEALKYLQAAQWPGWSLPAPPAPPIALNPKGQKSTQLCLGWRENLGRWGPALGHLLQLNNSSKSCVNSICWAQTPSVELSLAGLGRNLIFFLVWKAFKTFLQTCTAQERKPSHQAKLCFSLWHLLKCWCSLEMMDQGWIWCHFQALLV